MSVITYFWRNFDFSVLQNSCGGAKCAVASVTCKQRAGINSLESHSLCTTKNMKSFTMIHNDTQYYSITAKNSFSKRSERRAVFAKKS